MPWVAPNSLANCNLRSSKSTAIMGSAPTIAGSDRRQTDASHAEYCHRLAKLDLRRTQPAPAPVNTAQPIRQLRSVGSDGEIGAISARPRRCAPPADFAGEPDVSIEREQRRRRPSQVRRPGLALGCELSGRPRLRTLLGGHDKTLVGRTCSLGTNSPTRGMPAAVATRPALAERRGRRRRACRMRPPTADPLGDAWKVVARELMGERQRPASPARRQAESRNQSPPGGRSP